MQPALKYWMEPNESKQIFAAKYLKYLPTEAGLRRELQREGRPIEMRRSVALKRAEKP